MIEPTPDGRLYQTAKPLTVSGWEIPAGFPFDGITLGWFRWAFMAIVGGPYNPAIVHEVLLHDWLYCKKFIERKKADVLFYNMLRAKGFKLALPFFLAVRLFAGGRFK